MAAESVVVVVLVVATGVFRLVSALIAWLAARSGERTRARTLVALLRLAGPGAMLKDERSDGAALSVWSGSRVRDKEGGDVGES